MLTTCAQELVPEFSPSGLARMAADEPSPPALEAVLANLLRHEHSQRRRYISSNPAGARPMPGPPPPPCAQSLHSRFRNKPSHC